MSIIQKAKGAVQLTASPHGKAKGAVQVKFVIVFASSTIPKPNQYNYPQMSTLLTR